MGGSGGGGFSGKRTPYKVQAMVKKTAADISVSDFETNLSGGLGLLLGEYNSRDHRLVAERLDRLEAGLGKELSASFDQIFGGSVAKHTYVDGLSDIDSLLIINDTSLERKDPEAVLSRMQAILSEQLKREAKVTHGRMAVTVQFNDGMVIQLLPAIKASGDQLHVPSSRTDGWSRINPIKFQQALTKRNAECGGKLVPVIKLVKAIIGQLPENQRLSGYHVESLAIAAFKGYNGDKTTSAMLPKFFEAAKDLILSPIRDKSGQSVHVDSYLGPENSEMRRVSSHVLGRISRRMRNSAAAGSQEDFLSLFGE